MSEKLNPPINRAELKRIANRIREVLKEENLDVENINATLSIVMGSMWSEVAGDAYHKNNLKGASKVCSEFFNKTKQFCLYLIVKKQKKLSKNKGEQE